MSEHASDQQPPTRNELEQQSAYSQNVSDAQERWRAFAQTFQDMVSKLKPTKRKHVKGNDLQGFLGDLEAFDTYLDGLKKGQIEYGDFIHDIDTLDEQITKLVTAVDAASRVWERYSLPGLSQQQLADNDDAYAKRLSNCFTCVKELVKVFFEDDS